MKHPRTRSERRHNGEVWRNRQRSKILNCWFYRGDRLEQFLTNRMWWARKQSSGHGNRCICHMEKICDARKAREGKDIKSQRRPISLCPVPKGHDERNVEARSLEAVDQIVLRYYWQKREITASKGQES